jgi:hypothetical protein
MTDKDGKTYLECVVGNIIGRHVFGEQREIKNGIKHFRAGTKVYCVFMYGGMGHEEVRVMGKHRKSFRMIDIVIRTHYIKNFRVRKVYDPYVIDFLKKYPTSFDASYESEEFLLYLNTLNIEIKE